MIRLSLDALRRQSVHGRAGDRAGIVRRRGGIHEAQAQLQEPQSRPSRAKSQGRVRARKAQTKTQACLALIERAEGASIAEMQKATGWQPHSVRGFLAGTIKKTPGVTLTSEKPTDGKRRYRVQRVSG
jgi:hypothetical protein